MMMLRTFFRIVLVVSMVLLVSPLAVFAQETTKPAETQEKAKMVPPKVTVAERGAEPRRELRYRVAKGDRCELVLKNTMTMQQTMDGNVNPPVTVPTMVFTMRNEVTEITEQNNFRHVSTFTDAKVEGQENYPQYAPVRKLIGAKFSALMTTRGETLEADVEMDEDLQRQMGTMMENMAQMSVPLPEESVGLGAKWKAEMTMDVGGISFDQTAMYELVSIEGDRVRMKVTMTQSAQEQVVDDPNMPDGVTAKIDSLQSTGEGEMEIDLTLLTPLKSSMNLEQRMDMTVTAFGEITELLQKMNMTMEIAGQRVKE